MYVTGLALRPDGDWEIFVETVFSSGGFFPSLWAKSRAYRVSAQGVLLDSAPIGLETSAGLSLPQAPAAANHQDSGALVVAIKRPEGCTLARLTSDQLRAEGMIVEYLHPGLDHYFMTLEGTETEILDATPAMGWQRTGYTFGAWMSTPIAGATQTCRFYGDSRAGPNSHFYIPDGASCDAMERLDDATPVGTKAWRLEGLTFSVREAFANSCAPNLTPVERYYNRGYESGRDSNHRYVFDTAAGDFMTGRGWASEGIAFCVPPQSSRSFRRPYVVPMP
jgi:hypothetical protein